MIESKKLKKVYKMSKKVSVTALDDASFKIEEGSTVAIIGPSGSGKSTLLNILGGLDRDYQGEILIDGKDIKKYNQNYYRRHIVGTIFQQFYLVPTLSVAENIMLPVALGKQFDKEFANKRLQHLLEKTGLASRADHKPKELSGGQAQRVAIARALMTQPKVLLADEPTGNLDSKTGKEITELLYNLNKEEGTTLIIVTHDTQLFKDVKKKILLRDGKIVKK
jgi:putative ABC transport system ATP-binding protein